MVKYNQITMKGGISIKDFKIHPKIWLEALLFLATVFIIFLIFSNIGQIYYTFRGFLSVIMPFLFGFLIAYFLNGPCKFFEKQFLKLNYSFFQKFSRGLSVFTLFILVFGLISLIISYIFPIITMNVMEFIQLIPTYYLQVQNWIYNLDLAGFNDVFHVEEALQTFFADFSVQELLSHLTFGLNSITDFALSLSSGVLDTFLAIITSVYALLYKETIFTFFDRVNRIFVPESQYNRLKNYFAQANNIFYKFIATQFLDACILGILSWILLSILNVQFAVTLGIFLGFCNMIPKFGSIFGSIVVMILAFITGGLFHGLLVITLLTILQQIDGNIIGPKLMGNALDINPILVFIAIAVGGAYWGILGMFLAIPVVAMLKIVFYEWLEYREGKKKDLNSIIEEN
jgi:predicted PurR-regulated permease PerM